MKKIVFRPISKDAEKFVEKPIPVKKSIPDWFKNVPKYENNIKKIIDGPRINTTLKACMPFLDAFTTGYVQRTWTEIYFDSTNPNKIQYVFSSKPDLVFVRKNINYYPPIDNFDQQEFSWTQQWIPQLPDGYSMLYVHPLNRYDLPFLSLNAIIDNDKYYIENHANHPFFIKKNFKGIIPVGTPMFQMIPIKRDVWNSYFEPYSDKLDLITINVRKFFMDGYKKLYWQKKEYN